MHDTCLPDTPSLDAAILRNVDDRAMILGVEVENIANSDSIAIKMLRGINCEELPRHF